MTAFDFIVLFIIAVAAIGGFMRGFVQEILSLAAWILAVFAIRYLHTDLTEWLSHYIGTPTTAALLAFALLLLIGLHDGRGLFYYAGLAVGAACAVHEQGLIRAREPAACFRAFLHSHYIGLAVLVGLALDLVR